MPPMRLYTQWLRPAFFQFTPEQAHHLAMTGLKVGLGQAAMRRWLSGVLAVRHPMLAQKLWGIPFVSPVGLAAGFDKNAEALEELTSLGFSHVEAGTVTGLGQSGNPRPRCFRLPHDKSLINRMGFNNHGADRVATRLGRRYDPVGVGAQRRPSCVLGINLGKSTAKNVSEALDDHLHSLECLGPFADYVVLNVSCPNVQGVTSLQHAESLQPLLQGVRGRLRELAPRTPMLVKIGPDLDDAGIDAAVDVILACGGDGVLATNTSRARSGLRTSTRRVDGLGMGGLSGQAIRHRSTAVLARVARRIDGRVPLIGVGGIDSADVAWEKICHGASLVQVYTGFIYAGPTVVRDICRGLVARLKQHGLRHLREAVGRDL